MTRVLEVAAAEDVTGHPYSLAVTSPEGVTFVKGTCREETRWWTDVLQVYSRNKVGSVQYFNTCIFYFLVLHNHMSFNQGNLIKCYLYAKLLHKVKIKCK